MVWRFMTFPGFNNDHYVHLARAQQMLLGEWPVRDFEDPGMPLMYAASALAGAMFGPALGTEWALVACAFALGAACSVLACSRLSASVGIALLVATLQLVMNPRSFSYPKVVLYAVAALAILVAAPRPTGRRLVALALTTAVAFLFRHDHGLFIGFGGLATIVMASYAEGWRMATRRALVFVAWLAAFLAPWAIFVSSSQGLVEYFASAVAFSRSEAAYTGLRAAPRFDWSGLDTSANALSWLYYLFHALPLACLVQVMVRRRRRLPERWLGEYAAVSALALMAIPVNLVFLRGSLDSRLPDAVIPAGLLGSWLLGLVGTGWRGLPLAKAAGVVVVVLATAWAVVVAADVREQIRRTNILTGSSAGWQRAADLWDRLGRRLPERDHVPSRYSRALMPFLEYVGRCTSPGDRLMTTGLHEVYVLTQRGFAGGRSQIISYVHSRDADEERAMARLERQSVPFVLLVTQMEPEFRRRVPRIAAYMDARYRPMARIEVPETEGVDAWVERRRRSTGVDASTGWPCFR
jgi:MFS family permease